MQIQVGKRYRSKSGLEVLVEERNVPMSRPRDEYLVYNGRVVSGENPWGGPVQMWSLDGKFQSLTPEDRPGYSGEHDLIEEIAGV